MKKILVMILAAAGTLQAGAQEWELHIAAGNSRGKLIPMGDATPASKLIHYGFDRGGIYLSPELNIKVDEHSRFSLGYQFSESHIGVKFRPAGHSGGLDESYDILDMQNISVGYSYRTDVGKAGRFVVGGFAKVGIAYGQMAGLGESGNSGYEIGSGGYSSAYTSRSSGFEAIPDFWTPTATLGFIAGPNFQGRRVADRLMLNVAATIGLKNPYTHDSKTDYQFVTASNIYSGTAQWQGMPLLLQVGLDYNLFRFNHKAHKKDATEQVVN